MRGFHVNWTRPFSVRAPGLPYAVEPFELLTTALSALCWRRENGGICMVCDSPAAEYYASLGLDFLTAFRTTSTPGRSGPPESCTPPPR